MDNAIGPIQQIDLIDINEADFSHRHVGCIILSHDNKILLQQRDQNAITFAGCLATFGGRIEKNESPFDALARELKEELGAKVEKGEVVSLGAVIEYGADNSKTLIYVYFWHDKKATITGCYEGEARYHDNEKAALAHPKVMDDVKWLLHECDKRKLFRME